LNINELDKIENDIVLWLNRKKIQLDNCHVIINFTFRNNQFVIFSQMQHQKTIIQISNHVLNRSMTNVSKNRYVSQCQKQ
jgi:hypothetical protein